MERDTLVNFLNEYLKASEFEDYGYNGLQVPGKKEIEKVAFGVSANMDLFEKAKDFDAIVVHHGLFWSSDSNSWNRRGYAFKINDSLKKRLKFLFDRDINLIAYHLPLDAHPIVGNNAQILKYIGMRRISQFSYHKGNYIGFIGVGKKELEEIKSKLKKVNPNTFSYDFGDTTVKKVAVCSGHCVDSILEAYEKGVDLFITGDPEEHIPALAKELGMNILFLGHHYSETFGVKALSKLIKKKFRVNVEFIDIPNYV